MVFISAGFLFFNTSGVFAAECICYSHDGFFKYNPSRTTEASSKTECKNICKSEGYYQYDGTQGNVLNSTSVASQAGAAISGFLQYVLEFVGWILNLAILLFGWAIDADTLKTILTNNAIVSTWGIIRDLCNIGFILILLFSAFATVFQYSKYNYKSILMWLVIMALLVNFSFPITRFIIDITNSLMYTILGSELGEYAKDGGKIFTTGPAFGSLSAIVTPPSTSITQLIASIIFVFILALTILALAVILIIRTMALAIIIIFSPIGFVGTIVGKDGGWWNHLFKYAVAGPIIALVLFISIKLMEATNATSLSKIDTITPVIAGMASFAIPIIVLWMGIAMAIKGIDGAGAVMGRARRYGGTFARNLGGLRPLASWGFNKTGIPDGMRQRWANFQKSGFTGSDRTAERAAIIAGVGSENAVGRFFGGDNAEQTKHIKAAAERHGMDNAGTDTLENLRDTGNRFERAAAIQQLIDNNTFDMTDPANAAAYQTMRDTLGITSQAFNQINNKLKAFDPVSAFAHIPVAQRQTRINEHLKSNKFDAKKLGVNSLQNGDFMRSAFQNEVVSASDLEELRKKGHGHQAAIASSLGAIAGEAAHTDLAGIETRLAAAKLADPNSQATRDLETQQRVARNIQIAHVAQTGTFHAGVLGTGDAENARAQIITRLNADTAKRVNADTANVFAKEFAGNINSNKYKAIITGMEHAGAAQKINNQAKTGINTFTSPAQRAAFESNKRKANNDPDLMYV